MKAHLDLNHCSIQPEICMPLKECPDQAIFFIEDVNVMLGARIDVDDTKCKGCGTCIPLCCGNAISLKE